MWQFPFTMWNTYKVVVFTLLSLNCFPYTSDAAELLQNAGFESTQFHGNWHCNGCTLTSSSDSQFGQHSGLITNRRGDWSGPQQSVTVSEGQLYNFTAYIKLQTLQPGAQYQEAELIVHCPTAQNHNYAQFGRTPFLRLGEWSMIGGVTRMPSGAKNCDAYVQLHGHSANYYIDQVSLQQVQTSADWKTKAQARIEDIRKSDITVRVEDNGVNFQNMEIELEQTSHEFGFGTAVGSDQMVNPGLTNYQNFVYDNFEWAVIENALKWPDMEPNRGHINYDRPMKAIKVLKQHGLKVRGHNVFWGVDVHNPNWVKALNGQDLLDAMATRIHGVVGHFKGMLEHWDVNNENLHGNFFEQHTGDPNITMKMFRDVHAIDPHAKLFLNDYNLIDYGIATAGILNQAVHMKNAGIPIYGIGIQGHMHNSHFDIETVKARLDLIAQAGLPIWITELTVTESNENIKARALTDLYTLYFSHPSVEGVLLWGFWGGKISNYLNRLAEGHDVLPNAAGRAYQTLFKTTWRTSGSYPLHGQQGLKVRGFKGGYTIKVKDHGHVIKTETFNLGNGGQTVTIHLTNAGGTTGVSTVLIG